MNIYTTAYRQTIYKIRKEWGWGKGNGINGAEQEKEPEIGEYEDTRW